jgi:hypothetical protein
MRNFADWLWLAKRPSEPDTGAQVFAVRSTTAVLAASFCIAQPAARKACAECGDHAVCIFVCALAYTQLHAHDAVFLRRTFLVLALRAFWQAAAAGAQSRAIGLDLYRRDAGNVAAFGECGGWVFWLSDVVSVIKRPHSGVIQTDVAWSAFLERAAQKRFCSRLLALFRVNPIRKLLILLEPKFSSLRGAKRRGNRRCLELKTLAFAKTQFSPEGKSADVSRQLLQRWVHAYT